MRELTLEDARAAVLGGLVFGAGGGGLDAGLRAAESVFALGRPRLATLDELADDDQVFVSTGVGAPGAHVDGAAQNVFPRDKLHALELWRRGVAHSRNHAHLATRVVGLIVGHPGAGMVGSWLPAAVDPNIVVVDCATNGRGHPSVKMGGMGLASRPEVSVVQGAAGGIDDARGRLEVVIEGTLAASSDVIRRASAALGGSISACRGPFSVGFLRHAGAVGSISASLRLGAAMISAEGQGADRMVAAVTDTLGATVAVEGSVASNTVALRGAYDVGAIRIENRDGSVATLAICNEFMALDIDGQRFATFPDLIVVLSQKDGMPVPAATMRDGDPVVVVVADCSTIPVGAGVWDPDAYTGVEGLLGVNLTEYALRNAPTQQPA